MKPINYVTETEFPAWYAAIVKEPRDRMVSVFLKPAIDWYEEQDANMFEKALEQSEQEASSDNKLSAGLASNYHAMAMLYYVKNK